MRAVRACRRWRKDDVFAETPDEDTPAEARAERWQLHPALLSLLRACCSSAHARRTHTPHDAQELSGAQAAGELARVRYILRSLAPAEQDAAALAAAEATPPADARVTELLRFRVARKAALRARADAMRGRLGPHGDEL